MYYVGTPPTYLVCDIYTPKEKTRYGFQNVVSQLNICPCCLWWCLYNGLSTVLRLQHWLKETHWVPSPHELNWELICCPFWTSGEQKLHFQLEFKLDHSRLPGMAYLFYFKIDRIQSCYTVAKPTPFTPNSLLWDPTRKKLVKVKAGIVNEK